MTNERRSGRTGCGWRRPTRCLRRSWSFTEPSGGQSARTAVMGLCRRSGGPRAGSRTTACSAKTAGARPDRGIVRRGRRLKVRAADGAGQRGSRQAEGLNVPCALRCSWDRWPLQCSSPFTARPPPGGVRAAPAHRGRRKQRYGGRPRGRHFLELHLRRLRAP